MQTFPTENNVYLAEKFLKIDIEDDLHQELRCSWTKITHMCMQTFTTKNHVHHAEKFLKSDIEDSLHQKSRCAWTLLTQQKISNKNLVDHSEIPQKWDCWWSVSKIKMFMNKIYLKVHADIPNQSKSIKFKTKIFLTIQKFHKCYIVLICIKK